MFSHPVYSICTLKKIFKEVEEMNGVVIGGFNVNNLRYADDTALICFMTSCIEKNVFFDATGYSNFPGTTGHTSFSSYAAR